MSQRAIPVIGVANTIYVPMDRARLEQRISSMGISMAALSRQSGCSVNVIHRWITRDGNVPWGFIERIARAIGMRPESLGSKPKVFDPNRFNHYLIQRGVSVNRLLGTGRFQPYSYAAINSWRQGARVPSVDAVRALERGLDLPLDALTDGPIEQVTGFSSAELERWSDSTVNGQAGGTPSELPTIKDILCSWKESHGKSLSEFRALFPDYNQATITAWLQGRIEPSKYSIAVIERVLDLAPGSLVRRDRSRLPPPGSTHAQSQPPVPPPSDLCRPTAALSAGSAQPQPQRNAPVPNTGAAVQLFPDGGLEDAVPVLLDMLAQDIRTPRQWHDTLDYLVPHLLVRLPVWPCGRNLSIDSADGSRLVCSHSGRDPVPVRVYRQQGGYYGVEGGQPVAVRTDGDDFFRALLVSLGQEQVALSSGLSLGEDHSEQAIIESLRNGLAQYVQQHQQEVASVLEAWSSQTSPN